MSNIIVLSRRVIIAVDRVKALLFCSSILLGKSVYKLLLYMNHQPPVFGNASLGWAGNGLWSSCSGFDCQTYVRLPLKAKHC